MSFKVPDSRLVTTYGFSPGEVSLLKASELVQGYGPGFVLLHDGTDVTQLRGALAGLLDLTVDYLEDGDELDDEGRALMPWVPRQGCLLRTLTSGVLAFNLSADEARAVMLSGLCPDGPALEAFNAERDRGVWGVVPGLVWVPEQVVLYRPGVKPGADRWVLDAKALREWVNICAMACQLLQEA